MPRFVLLRHECPIGYEKPSHWDLMLEANELLQTWELRQLPAAWVHALGDATDLPACASVLAIRLADHRLAYLDYEGPISGNRGTVRRCDGGTYEIVGQDDRLLQVSLSGNFLQGAVHLRRDAAQPRVWQLLAPNNNGSV